MTDVEFQAALDSDNFEPVTLYHLGAFSTVASVEVVRRLSNRAYRNGAPDAPYAAAIAQDLRTVEAITADGKPRVSASEIKVWNPNGERNSWLGDVWYNRDLFVYLGDRRWPESDFRLMYVGVIEDVCSTPTSPDSDPSLTVKLRDVMDRLNAPVSELTMPDGSIWPHAFGEACNITPKLKSLVPLEYTYHPTATEGVIGARVEGMTRELVVNKPAAGAIEFQTAIGPGTVTLSVQGDKTGGVYRKTIAQLVRLLVQSYGREGERFADSEIDLANFAAFDLAHPYAVGDYMTERRLVIDQVARFASSVRAQLVPSMVGKLRLLRCRVPATAAAEIRTSQYLAGSLVELSRRKVVGAVVVGYCQNHTPQPNLASRLKPAFKAMFAAPWRATQPRVNEQTVTRYRLTRAAAMIETRLLNEADAIAVADDLLAEDSEQRTDYAVTGTRSLMLQQLGQGVILYGKDYDLQSGKVGQIRLREIDFDYRKLTVNTEITV